MAAVLAAVTIAGLSTLAGCSTTGLSGAPQATGSIPVNPVKVSASASVDPSDWETVRRTIAAIPVDKAPTLDWSNPDTGSTGSLTVGAAGEDPVCRAFATTVSDPQGIRRFRGQACRGLDGRWQLKGLSADDTLFS